MWLLTAFKDETGVVGQTAWLPVLDLGRPHHRIGFNSQGVWLVETGPDGTVETASALHIPLLPVLEMDPRVVKEAITAVGHRIGIPDLMDHFPINEILEVATRGTSNYWAARALSWAELNAVPGSLRDRLAGLADAPWATQEVRHRAQRLRRPKE